MAADNHNFARFNKIGFNQAATRPPPTFAWPGPAASASSG